MAKQRTAEELAFRDAAALAAMSQLVNVEPFCLKAKSPLMQNVVWMALASESYRIAEAMCWARNEDFIPKKPETV